MLNVSLILIIGVFCVIMFGVLGFCLQARKRVLARRIASVDEERAEDARVIVVLFGSVVVGAVLALVAMYLVFFRQWE